MKKSRDVLATLRIASMAVLQGENPNRQIMFSNMNMYGKTVVGVKAKTLKPAKTKSHDCKLKRVYRRG